MLAEGRTFAEIADIRGRQLATVISQVAELVEKGEVDFQPEWVTPENMARIQDACAQLGVGRLSTLKEVLP